MATLPSCPYCNAVVAVPAGTRAGQLVPCPRCGERFPYHGPTPEENGAPPGSLPTAAPEVQPTAEPESLVDRAGERLRTWSKRTILLTILGVMALMAGSGLALALMTQRYRRANDRLPAPDETAARVRIAAPPDLAGLGYLPADTDVIAAVHVAEALQEPAGQQFLRRFRPEEAVRGPREQELPLGGFLEQWTGLAPEDLDHVVLGLKVAGNAIPPRAILVAQTRRRYDAGKILTALKAKRVSETDRPLYQFHIERLGQTPVLWFAGEHTFVVALTAEQMAEVPETPEPGATHFAAPLQEVLTHRLGPGSQAWVVGHADDWDRTTARLVLAILPPAEGQLLRRVRSFAVGLRFADGLTLSGAFQCADATAARKLEERLAPPPGAERKPLPLVGARLASAPVAADLARTLKVVRDEEWVTLQARAGPDALAPGPPTTAREK